jgi:glycosyltransferase involved in cell wall biosynthesis
MAAGCPVVTSNVSSLPEVAGDAALLVDPYDVDAIAEAIQSVCSDSSLAADLAKRGRTRAGAFTWERCAEQVACIYRNVVARK